MLCHINSILMFILYQTSLPVKFPLTYALDSFYNYLNLNIVIIRQSASRSIKRARKKLIDRRGYKKTFDA
jgi:hypothetical protein